MAHPIDIIKKFALLTEEDELRLRGLMVERSYKRREVVTGTRAIVPFAFYIKNGAARSYFTRNGREYTLAFSFDDQFITLPRHLVEYDDTFSIEFLEATSVITLPHFKLRDEIIDSNIQVNQADVMLFINTALSQYSRSLEDHLTAILHYSAVERYHWAIEQQPRLLEVATITQIASYLGLTKETLYRIRSGKY